MTGATDTNVRTRNPLKRWWYKRKLKKAKSDLYWIQAEMRGLEPSPWVCILAMNELHRLRDIDKLEKVLGL